MRLHHPFRMQWTTRLTCKPSPRSHLELLDDVCQLRHHVCLAPDSLPHSLACVRRGQRVHQGRVHARSARTERWVLPLGEKVPERATALMTRRPQLLILWLEPKTIIAHLVRGRQPAILSQSHAPVQEGCKSRVRSRTRDQESGEPRQVHGFKAQGLQCKGQGDRCFPSRAQLAVHKTSALQVWHCLGGRCPACARTCTSCSR